MLKLITDKVFKSWYKNAFELNTDQQCSMNCKQINQQSMKEQQNCNKTQNQTQNQNKLKLHHHKKTLKWYERIFLQIIKQGQVPKHIAFIMDGNRRFAQDHTLPKHKGHEKGVSSLKRCLEFCLALDIQIVSVFAFAIENFNREQTEVEKIMGLFVQTLNEMSQEDDFLQARQVRVRVVGDKDLLKRNNQTEVLKIIQQVETLTASFTRLQLNICFAYNSSFEMGHYFATGHLLIPQDVDLMIRTSDEHRLSNFLLCQSNTAMLHFVKEHWPEFSFASFFQILLYFQIHYDDFVSQRNFIKQLDNDDAL